MAENPHVAPLNAAACTVVAMSLVLTVSGHAGEAYPLLITLIVTGFAGFALQLAGSRWALLLALLALIVGAILNTWPVHTNPPSGPVGIVLTWAGLGYAAGLWIAGALRGGPPTGPTPEKEESTIDA